MSEIQNVYYSIRDRISKDALWGGILVFIFGFFIHMFVFVNHYPTYSGLNLFINDGKWHAIEGRWFSSIIERCTSVVTIPTFIGILSLLFWAVSYTIFLCIWSIKNRIVIFLAAGVFISFPVIAGYYTFLYTAHCFALGAMLACLGTIFLFSNNRKVRILSVICFVLSLATYQTTISIAMTLILVNIAFNIINGDDIRGIAIDILRYIVIVLLSFVIYYLSFKAYLAIANAVSYRDISFSLNSLLAGIRKCYGGAYWFWVWGTLFSLPVGRIIVSLQIIILICEVIIICINKRKDWSYAIGRFFMLGGLACLLPMVANYAFLLSPNEDRTYRQFIAYIIIFILPIILIDRYQSDFKSVLKNKSCILALESSIMIYSILAIVFFSVSDNIAYMNMHLQYEKEYSLAIRIVDRIETTDGYKNGMPVVLVFRKDYSHLYGGSLESRLDKYIPGMEQRGWGIMYDAAGIKNFISEFIQTDINIVYEKIDLNKLEEMSKWPQEGCTMIKDGILYVYIS